MTDEDKPVLMLFIKSQVKLHLNLCWPKQLAEAKWAGSTGLESGPAAPKWRHSKAIATLEIFS